MKLRCLLAAIGTLVAIWLVAWPRPAAADARRVAFLAERLKYPPAPGLVDDFRVRTNAALALGSTDDDTAVGYLCAALVDPSEVVRQAVAAALKRLGRSSSLRCLRSRLASEPSSAVKLQLSRAMASIEQSEDEQTPLGSFSPKHVAGATYYVALAPVANRTGRPRAEIEQSVLVAIQNKLEALGRHQLAPLKESPEAAKKVMRQRSLKGYYLSVAVEPFEYSSGSLRVSLRIAVSSYPGKDLRGEVPARLVQTGVSPNDRRSERQLLQMAAGHAAEQFARLFP